MQVVDPPNLYLQRELLKRFCSIHTTNWDNIKFWNDVNVDLYIIHIESFTRNTICMSCVSNLVCLSPRWSWMHDHIILCAQIYNRSLHKINIYTKWLSNSIVLSILGSYFEGLALKRFYKVREKAQSQGCVLLTVHFVATVVVHECIMNQACNTCFRKRHWKHTKP